MIDRTVLYPVGDNPPRARLIYGRDALMSLKELPDQCVHMVATSPPYFGLRCYSPDLVQLRADLTQEERTRILAELLELDIGPIVVEP